MSELKHGANLMIPRLLAHRGVSARAPENTLSAFELARASGLRWLECDVTLTACGEVVVFHDDTLERTTNGVGVINEVTYEYLKTLDAGSWFSSEYRGEKIPTLREVLLFLSASNMSANLEIKAYPGKEMWVARRVLEEIKRYAVPQLSLLITSFSKNMLDALRYQACELPLGLLLSEWDESYRDVCSRLALTSIGIDYNSLTLERVQALKFTNCWVLAYTVNDVDHAERLFSWGLDAVFSDCPLQMVCAFKDFL